LNITLKNKGKAMNINYNRQAYEKVYSDLDDYLRFCKVFGHAYDPAALYNMDDPNYATYSAFKSGTRISNNWMRDAKRNGRNIFLR
jgi:hypothetical protein